MHQTEDLRRLQRRQPAVLTVGAFDGVHLGHQYLIGQAVNRARFLEAESVVVTFDPRPQVVLRAGSLQLTDGEAKSRLIGELEPDVVVMLTFTRELASMPAEVFLTSILDHVNLAEIWVGADFAFGHNRAGDVNFLIRNGEAYGYAVHVVPRQEVDGVAASSTLARRLVASGDVREASRFLGHFFGFSGTVVTGHGRGLPLGYPTANVQPPHAQQLPATGIYAGYVWIESRCLRTAMSVGYNPVFGGEELSVEAHILDFDGDLRGRRIRLEFVERLRDEQNFGSVDALVEQMGRDVERTREILAGTAAVELAP